MGTISPLKQERLNRHWPRSYVEVLTEGRILAVSLERWEHGKNWPQYDNITELCQLYGKSPKELGLDRSSDIMGFVENNTTPTSQEENPIMSDLVRRTMFSNLGSKLTGLIDTWPKRNYHYEELQGGINQAIVGYNAIVAHDSSYELTRRQALKDMALVPVVIYEASKQKSDTDTLLKHCAAGITACWYLRRGRDLSFVSDLTSSYISILQSLIYSHSEAYWKASARLLAQSFGLKSRLVNVLQEDDQAIAYEEEAIRYALVAESVTEQVIANRGMALLYWRRKKYKQALPYAETAYGLAKSNKATPRIIRSFTASGLSFCQASSGKTEDAKISLKEAHNYFDPTILIPSMPYNEVMLLSSSASVHQHIGDFKEATSQCKKILMIPDISVISTIHERIKYAGIEVSRDDQTRDMNLCITLLTEAITGARELDSKPYQHEAREVYDLLRIAWPREDAIKKLGKEHFKSDKKSGG